LKSAGFGDLAYIFLVGIEESSGLLDSPAFKLIHKSEEARHPTISKRLSQLPKSECGGRYDDKRLNGSGDSAYFIPIHAHFTSNFLLPSLKHTGNGRSDL
jgi:hypothetical protein